MSNLAKKEPPPQSLVAQFAANLRVEPDKLLATLRATAFRTGKNEAPVTNEEMLGLLAVARQYNLNPLLKEIYAFRDQKGGIIPVIGIDGFIRIAQNRPEYGGVEFKYDEEGAWVECTVYRRDQSRPTVVREYLEECRRNTGPWQSHPRRMLRHRAYAQCVRVAFGFGGVYEEDEGEAYAAKAAQATDFLPLSAKAAVTAPQPKADVPLQLATEDHLEMLNEKLAKTGVPENLVLAKFEVGALEEIPAGTVADVLKFIQDNAP